jgi:hypothetical protein
MFFEKWRLVIQPFAPNDHTVFQLAKWNMSAMAAALFAEA